jgi:hypothetical protein
MLQKVGNSYCPTKSNILLTPKVLQKSNILEVAQKGAFCYNMFLR